MRSGNVFAAKPSTLSKKGCLNFLLAKNSGLSAEFKLPLFLVQQAFSAAVLISCEFQFPRNLNSARYVNRWKSSRKNILSQWSTVHEQVNQGEK